MARSPKSRLGIALLTLALVAGDMLVPASSALASPTAPSSVIEQHWELLAETATYTGSGVVHLRRGSLPGGVSKFDPAPTVTLEVTARHAGGATGSSWSVALHSSSLPTSPLAVTTFAGGTAGEITLRSSPFSWPATDTLLHSLRLTKNNAGVALAGDLHLVKAYLKIHQQGTIKGTQARVPLTTKQVNIATTSWQNVADVAFYRHAAWDFDPAPVISFRTSGVEVTSNPIFQSLHVRLVDDDGEPVPGATNVHTQFSSVTSNPLTLEDGRTYHVQVRVTDPLQRGELHSAELQLEQATTDPTGLARSVAWIPSLTAAQTAAVTSDLGFLTNAPQIVVAERNDAWWQTAKRTTGAGAVRVDLVTVGSTPAAVGLELASSTYGFKKQPSVTSIAAGSDLDSRLVVGAGAVGRVSQSILRIAVGFHSGVGPFVPAFAPDPSAISPNADGVKDGTNLTFSIQDVGDTSWMVSVKTVAGDTVMTEFGVTEGSAHHVDWGWDGSDSAGVILVDAVYELVLEASDQAGNSITTATQVIIDTVPPGIIRILPEDGGHTAFGDAQPLAALVDNTGSGLDPSSLRFTLTPLGGISTVHPALVVGSWMRTDPVPLTPGSRYFASAEATDNAGNHHSITHGVANGAGGFLSIHAQSGEGVASIPRVPCDLGELAGQGLREIQCPNVPIQFTAEDIVLSASAHPGRGHVPYTTLLEGALATNGEPGNDEETVSAHQAGDPAWGPKHQLLPFFVSEESPTERTYEVQPMTLEIDTLTTYVPASWTQVFLKMDATQADAGLVGCADPTLVPDSSCGPDPVSEDGRWEVPIQDPHVASCDSALTARHAVAVTPSQDLTLQVQIDTTRLEVEQISLAYAVDLAARPIMSQLGGGEDTYSFTIPAHELEEGTRLSFGYMAEGDFTEPACSSLTTASYPSIGALEAWISSDADIDGPGLGLAMHLAVSNARRQPGVSPDVALEQICAQYFQIPTPCDLFESGGQDPGEMESGPINILEWFEAPEAGGCPVGSGKTKTYSDWQLLRFHRYKGKFPPWEAADESEDERNRDTRFADPGNSAEWWASEDLLGRGMAADGELRANGGYDPLGYDIVEIAASESQIRMGAKVGYELDLICTQGGQAIPCTSNPFLDITLEWEAGQVNTPSIPPPIDLVPIIAAGPYGAVVFAGGNPLKHQSVSSRSELWKGVIKNGDFFLLEEGILNNQSEWIGNSCYAGTGLTAGGCGVRRAGEGQWTLQNERFDEDNDLFVFMQLNMNMDASANMDFRARIRENFGLEEPDGSELGVRTPSMTVHLKGAGCLAGGWGDA